MTEAMPKTDLAAEWCNARLLYPIYTALLREFAIDTPACADLESALDAPSREQVEAASAWLDQADTQIAVYQLRQFLQISALANTPVLQALLTRHLNKAVRNDSDRDKVDFLLVQFFASVAPSNLETASITLQLVADTLAPVLGPVSLTAPAWLQAIESVLLSAQRCRSLNELLAQGILENGRKLKAQAGANFFQPVAMVAFTRFSFLMRRTFFRLMHDDLNAILDGLRELERRGTGVIDCRQAQFSDAEPVLRLRMICQSWKVMFQAEYSTGQPLRMLVDLRSVVEKAVNAGNRGSAPPASSSPLPRARAAAAGVPGPAPRNPAAAPEFEISAPAQDWKDDSVPNEDDGAV